MRRLNVVIGVALLAGIVGSCNGSADESASVATAAAEPPPCSLDPTNRDRCQNLIAFDMRTVSPASLRDSLASLTWNVSGTTGVVRRSTANAGACAPGAYPKHVVRAPAAATKMPPARTWPHGTVAALAKFVPHDLHDECADSRYNVGWPKGGEYYLIATIDTKDQVAASGGLVIGEWQILQFTTQGENVRQTTVSSGRLIDCDNRHVTSKYAKADFLTCAKKGVIMSMATDSASLDVLMNAYMQLRGDTLVAGVSVAASGQSILTPEVMAKLRALRDGNEDPVWFSCGMGCCIAESPGGEPAPGVGGAQTSMAAPRPRPSGIRSHSM